MGVAGASGPEMSQFCRVDPGPLVPVAHVGWEAAMLASAFSARHMGTGCHGLPRVAEATIRSILIRVLYLWLLLQYKAVRSAHLQDSPLYLLVILISTLERTCRGSSCTFLGKVLVEPCRMKLLAGSRLRPNVGPPSGCLRGSGLL